MRKIAVEKMDWPNFAYEDGKKAAGKIVPKAPNQNRWP
jgi:hypothetical protein